MASSDHVPTPVRRAAALSALGLAAVNVAAIVWGWSGEVVAAVNMLVGAVVGVYQAFVVHEQVTPVEGLRERLEALANLDENPH